MKLFTLTISELLQKLEEGKTNKNNPYFYELKRKLKRLNLDHINIDGNYEKFKKEEK